MLEIRRLSLKALKMMIRLKKKDAIGKTTYTRIPDLIKELRWVSLIKSLLFYPTDHKVQDFKGTSFSKSQERTTEKDAPPLAVNKGFLKVDSVAVDHREDETRKTDKVDKDLKTTVNQTDVSG